MWFRLLLIAFAAGAWAGLVWLGSHASREADVFGRWSASYFTLLCTVLALALAATIAHLPPVYRRLFGWRWRLVVPATAVVGALALAEAAVRVFDPLGISYYERAKQYHLDKLPDPELVFRHRPNFTGRYLDSEYRFNERGLRERPIGPKAEDEFRVVVLGDSLTLGSGVAVEDAYVRRLEVHLNRNSAGATTRRFRTINCGVGGYETVQQLAFLERHGDELEPDLVLLLFVQNDVQMPMPFDPERQFALSDRSPPEVIKLSLSRSWLFRLCNHLWRFRGYDAAAQPDPNRPGWRASMRAFRGIARYCSARRLPFCAFLWGTSELPTYRQLMQDLDGIAREEGVAFTGVAPWFEGRDPAEFCNSVVDTHPNPEAHAILARRMARFLTERHLVPE